MPRLISADVIDDSTGDWTISDEGAGSGAQRGPVHTWPAPALRHDDRNPLLPFKSNPLNSRGQLDAYDFLRVKVDHPVNSFGDDVDPPHDTRGYDSYEERIDASLLVDDVRGKRNPTYGDFDAGMLLNPSDFQGFIRRTDAGALDSCCDAGMPQSWYDGIDKARNTILQRLQTWSGGKLLKADVDLLTKQFSELIAHATDNEKWNRFNVAKNTSFKLLDSVDSPIVSGGATATQAQEIMRRALSGQGGSPNVKLATTIRAPMSAQHGAHVAELTEIWKNLEAHINNQGGGLFKVIGSAVSSVGSGIASVGKGAFAIAKGVATPVAGLITSPVKLVSDIASGKNVLESVKDTVTRDIKNVKGIAPYAQAVISFVPGIGAGVNAAIAAGSALANGQPITSALVAGLKGAIPGGPVASQAFETAYNVARGQNVGEAALSLARNQIPGGPAAKAAFDAGIAVAKGQNLQQAAVGVVKGAAVNFVPGNNAIIKEAVSDIASGKNIAATALKAGTSTMATFSPLATGPFSDVGPRMLNTISTQNLKALLPSDVQKVANAVLKNASLRSLSANELAAKLNVPNHVAREGMASVLQSVLRSGGATVPHLAPAKELASKIPMTASFDKGMAQFASKMSPIAFSHNARRPMGPGTRHAAMSIAVMKNPYIVPVYAQQSREASLARANAINPWRRDVLRSATGYGAGALDLTTLPVLKQGSTGPFVVQWQNILKTSADGKFGPQTTSLTRQFQALKGLTADGIVGPNTWKAGLASIMIPTAPGLPPISIPGLPPVISAPIANAMPTIRQGSTGTAVKTWQAIVGVPADGQFGPQTATATRSWQSKNGLTADGIVGPQTWTKALAGGATTIPLPPPPTSLPPSIPIGPIAIPVPGGPPIVIEPPALPPWTGTPPVITTTTPIPGGPIITTTTTPTGGGPIVVSQPPITEPPTKAGMGGAGVAIAVGLGLLYFVAKGSSGKIL